MILKLPICSRLAQRLLLLVICLSLWGHSFGQNVCLDFDGVDDYVSTSIPLGNSNFTVEVWFLSKGNNTSTGLIQRIFSFGGNSGTRFEIGLSNSQMRIVWDGPNFENAVLSNTNYNDLNWHHLAVTRSGGTVQVYIDQILQTTPLAAVGATGFDITYFRLGLWPGGIASNSLWKGELDEVKIFNYAKTQLEISNKPSCPCTGDETGLELYWPLDEGIANGNNTAISMTIDKSPNSRNGTINNFALTGTNSNYVTSNIPFPTPYLNDMDIAIRDYPYQMNLLTDICPSDPAHFTLDQNGMVPSASGNVSVEWFYQDNGGTPVSLPNPIFGDFKMGIPSNEINYDCSSSTDGFVNRTFYAITSVTNTTTGDICTFRSKDYNLRICCPISNTSVAIAPNAPLCEGDVETVTVTLNSSDPFIQTPGPNILIEWCYNGTPLGPAYDNLTTFNYTINAPIGITSPQSLCFEAKITNCNNKAANFSSCLTVDPKPVCGTITAFPLGSPLNLMATADPNIWEICPNNDAQIGIDQPFLNCNPQWQYTFDISVPLPAWTNLGFTNSIQNTNVLPSYLWPPGATSIYYQIECQPLSSPSGCMPCYSNILEVRLKPEPIPNSISGLSQVCKGDQNTLTLASTDPSVNYTWFCNGIQVATGTSYTYTADASACYWIESRDAAGCYVVESPQFCVEVCEVIAAISCPLLPNDCACLGDPITLSACNSTSTCANPNLQFSWVIDGVPQSTTACSISHTPQAIGSTYQVTVTDLTTGCTNTVSRTVIPCDKNTGN